MNVNNENSATITRSPELEPSRLALVTGATGFTGRVLVTKLCALGLKVRGIARTTSIPSELKDLPIEWIIGQVYDPEVIDRAIVDVQYVFHLAAAYRRAGIPDNEYRRVHVESTQQIARAALRQSSFRRMVQVSTVGVHGHIEHPPADESAPFAPGDIYQKTKAEAELWLHEFARANSLPYTVIRPVAIYGPGDRRLLKLFRMAKAPFFVLLGRGAGLYHLIHVEDLADAIIRAAGHPAALGEAFICGDPASTSLEEIGRIISSELGKPFRVLRIPAGPFFLLADFTEALCKPFKIPPPIYRRRVAFFTKDRAFNTAKLRERLGFQFRWTTESGLRATTQWYLKHGWL